MPRFTRQRDGRYVIIGFCIEACYDNPLFEEDRTFKSENHVKNVHKKETLSNDYRQSEDREIDFEKGSVRRRKICLIVAGVTFIAVFAVVLGILLNNVKGDEKRKNDITTTLPSSFLFTTDIVDGNLRIVHGPFSVYREEYKDRSSLAFKLFSNSFTYKIRTIFLDSRYGSVYNHTTIISISSDQTVYFSIHFKSFITISTSTESTMQYMITSGLRKGLIIADPNSVYIIAKRSILTTTTSTDPDQCKTVFLAPCVNATQYTRTILPNAFNHLTQAEVTNFFDSNNIPLHCYGYSNDFWCSALNPECKNGKGIPPCQQYCKDVNMSCNNEQSWPIDCSTLPDSDDPDICRQNPYKPGKCIFIPEGKYEACRNIGFNKTSFPNLVGDINVHSMEMNAFLDLILNINFATKCYKHTALFACSTYIPQCSGIEVVPRHVIPPCRSLCEAFKSNCFLFWEIFAMPWPENFNCSSLPDVDDTSICIGYKEAREPPEIKECESDETKCDVNRCISKSYFCDGYQDCEDNSDENLCAQCPSGQQRCKPGRSNMCIDNNQICDGERDCYMGVEEDMCVQLGNGSFNGTLHIRNEVGSQYWEEVCSMGWKEEHSKIACSQLGYAVVMDFTEVEESSGTLKSFIRADEVNGTDPALIQSHLLKGTVSSCPQRKVVKLTCGNPVCGTRPGYYPSPLRIVNGEEVTPGTWPFLVELLGGPRKLHFCGASIIGHHWVITAAHCIGAKSDTSNIYINLGETRRYAFSEYRRFMQAKSFYVHPGYSPVTVENDIALIELEDPIYFNDYIRPICLPNDGQITPIGTRCYVAGWGKAGDNAPDYEPALMQINLDVVQWTRCENDIENAPTKSPFKLTEDMMCAGGGLDHDACSGDSGGPLMCPINATSDHWRLTGIVSWGLGCAVPNVPGVYTQVHKYASWIRNVTRNEIHIGV